MRPGGTSTLQRRNALSGGAFWIVAGVYCALSSFDSSLGLIELLLLFGPLVAVPGGLEMALGGQALRGQGLLGFLVLPAAVCAIAGRCLGPDIYAPADGAIHYLSAGLCLPWLLVTGLIALLGLQRILKRGLAPIEETAIDVGLFYLPVGGGWLVISSAGVVPTILQDLEGNLPEIVLLTAVHFHFAGFSAAVIAGLAGRALKAGVSFGESARPPALAAYRFAAAVVIIGPPLVAVGIMASPIIEVISGVALSLGMLTLAFVLVLIALSPGPGILPKVLLCAAALSLTATMALSTTYAVGEYMYPGEDKLIPNHLMAATHGVVNVLGFTLCGGLGLFLLRRKDQ